MTQITQQQVQDEIERRKSGSLVSKDDIDAEIARRSSGNGQPESGGRTSLRESLGSFVEEQEDFFFPERPDTNVLESIGQDPESSLGATVGGIVGGVAGTVAGRGSPAGSAFGSGAGAFVGDQIDQGIRRFLDLPTQDTFLESVGKSGKEGAFFTGADLVGQGVIKGIEKGAGRIKSKITPAKADAANFLETEVGLKPPLSLGQLTESRPIDLLENVSEVSLIGGGTIIKLKTGQKEGTVEFAKQFANSITREVKNPDQLGDLVMAVIRGKAKPAQEASKVLFNTVFGKTRNLKRTIRTPGKTEKVDILDMRPMKEWVNNVLGRDIKKLKGINQVTGKNIINKITQQPDFISLSEANQLRTALRKLGEGQPLVPKSASANRIGNTANAKLLAEMRKTLQQFAPQEVALFDKARKLSFEGSKPFRDKFIKQLLTAGDEKFGNAPATIAKKIFAKNNGRNIEKLKTFIDDETFTILKGHLWRDILERSTNKDTGEIIGTKLHTTLFSESGLGASTLNATFNKQELTTMRSLANALKEVERREGESIGKMAIQFAQAGAVLQLATGDRGVSGGDKAAVAILVGPSLIAKAFTNPRFIELVIKGQTTKNQKALVGVLTKIVAELSSVDDFIISEFNKPGKKAAAPVTSVPPVR
tara:strand:- start:29 stop:1975 length:1947 start_codon:yes stop_codon:yes gene_type:complete